MSSVLEHCNRCQAGMSASDLRCPACGNPRAAPLATQVASPMVERSPGSESPHSESPHSESPRASAPAGSIRSTIDNPYAVLAAVFFALAVFGIPLIWMCRAWSPAVKLALTLVTIAYTAVLLWLFWLVMVWCWQRISGAI